MLRRLLGGFEEADRPTSFVDLGIGACLFYSGGLAGKWPHYYFFAICFHGPKSG